MSYLFGNAKTSIDENGRLSLPALFRNAIAENIRDKLFLTLGHDGSIYGYPLDEWEKIIERNRLKDYDDPEVRFRMRQMATNFDVVKIDKQGRVYLPARLLQEVGIQKEVLILGTIDKMEFWNPDAYRSYNEKNRN